MVILHVEKIALVLRSAENIYATVFKKKKSYEQDLLDWHFTKSIDFSFTLYYFLFEVLGKWIILIISKYIQTIVLILVIIITFQLLDPWLFGKIFLKVSAVITFLEFLTEPFLHIHNLYEIENE